MAKAPKALYDIPVELSCPHCSDGIKQPLRRIPDGTFECACPSCRRDIQFHDEQIIRALLEHSNKLDALR